MPQAARHLGLLAVAAATLVSACATHFSNTGAAGEPPLEAVELIRTPFFPQTENQCGPAALATVLNHSGAEVGISELQSAVYIPDREGSLQLELVAAVRGRGRIPYQIDPSLAALVRELHAGRPVLVLQNLGLERLPRWHYAVVIGYLPDDRRIVLRSGGIERHLMSETAFLRSWRRADNWGLVVLRTDELPVMADETRYLRAVAALESTGRYETASQAYRTALQHWPANTFALLGLGNTHHALGDLSGAEQAYRQLLRREPDHAIALNNLAETLAYRGCTREAAETIDAAIRSSELDDPLFGSLVATRDQIAAMTATSCSQPN